jgi:hypothetical protein
VCHLLNHRKPGPSPHSGIFDGPVEDPAVRGSNFYGFASEVSVFSVQVSGFPLDFSFS